MCTAHQAGTSGEEKGSQDERLINKIFNFTAEINFIVWGKKNPKAKTGSVSNLSIHDNCAGSEFLYNSSVCIIWSYA